MHFTRIGAKSLIFNLIKKKFLILRFSSIGDIVLTTPIIRNLRLTYPDADIHFLSKKKFESVLQYNPYINHLHVFENDINECIGALKKERFDFIIDLHNNLRTTILKLKLRRPSAKFDKLNFGKWLLVNFKINRLPNKHIVDRYFETAKSLNICNDQKGLDFFLPTQTFDTLDKFNLTKNNYVTIAIGAAHATKQIPENKILEVVKKIKLPVVLLGDNKDVNKANNIISKSNHPSIINACGVCNLMESAYLIQQSNLLITSDTGLMHIASAFKKTIYSFWGNTVPEFGMSPYKPNIENKIFEVKNLSCRPCSKIGFDKCPKGHFDCMNKIDLSAFRIQD
jgi:ADP-heptose:LPS heptosyltransferase